MTSLVDDDKLYPEVPGPANPHAAQDEARRKEQQMDLATQIAIQQALDQNQIELQEYQRQMAGGGLAGPGAPPVQSTYQNNNPQAPPNLNAPQGVWVWRQVVPARMRRRRNNQSDLEDQLEHSCCVCIEIKSGLTLLALVNAAFALWFIVSPIFSLMDIKITDQKLLIYFWVAVVFGALLLIPVALLCHWLSNDNYKTRKRMEQAYCLIIFIHLLRITWILAASYLMFDTSVEWYIRQLIAKSDSKLSLNPKREKYVNDTFMFRFVVELIVLILFNQYFYRVAQRFVKLYRRDGEAAQSGPNQQQLDTERQLNSAGLR